MIIEATTSTSTPSSSSSSNNAPVTKRPMSSTPSQTNFQMFCGWTRKMKIVLVLALALGVISVAGACLFRNPTLFMYPLHASCNVTWTFQRDCTEVRLLLMNQMEIWKDSSTCGNGQKCLYTLGQVVENEVHGIHTTPKGDYIDDMQFKLYRNTATGGCNVVGYSTSRVFFALLDFGTNYCNLHNLMEGAGLTRDPHYSELTRDEICTQYTSANCEKY